MYFNMAMSQDEWAATLQEIGIPDGDCLQTYAKTFHDNALDKQLLLMLDTQGLKDLGVTLVGHQLMIIRHIKSAINANSSSTSKKSYKISELMNKLKMNITTTEFDRFESEWRINKTLIGCRESEYTIHLYGLTEDEVRAALLANDTYNQIVNMAEDELINKLRDITVAKVNVGVCRSQFHEFKQNEAESLSGYMMRLQTKARECKFTCFKCKEVDNDSRVFDRFITGIRDARIQIDLFTNIDKLTTLKELLKQAEVYETAINSHGILTTSSNNNNTSIANFSSHNANHYRKQWGKCKSCGKVHDPNRCPAIKVTCYHCGHPGHYARCCTNEKAKSHGKTNNFGPNKYFPSRKRFNNRNSNRRGVHAVASGGCDTGSESSDDGDTRGIPEVGNFFEVYSVGGGTTEEVEVLASACNRRGTEKSARIQVFPDSGASLCLGGRKHQKQLQLQESDLSSTEKQVRVVGGRLLKCYGKCKVRFQVGAQQTVQDLYFCDNVERLYFSKKACIEVKILPENYPMPMEAVANEDHTCVVLQNTNGKTSTGRAKQRIPPQKPKRIPFEPTEENIPKLKKFLLESFSSTTFNREGIFPTLDVPPMEIHLRKDAVPRAHNTPNTIPLHAQKVTKQTLDSMCKRDIIEKISVDLLLLWRSKMVSQLKKDGISIRIMIDLAYLSSQCVRTPYPFSSPFQLASQVPNNTYKSVLDAVDGYFMIPLAEESRHLTAFITPWGTYQFKRAPQGFFNSGDKFDASYGEVLKDVERIVRMKDDAMLYDFSVEEHFWHIWNFLYLCATSGIVLNEKKFQFCVKTAKFAGLNVTPNGITPSDEILKAIKEFKAPTDIHSVRSWFGLVRQVAWAHSLKEDMEPFRELLKKNVKFCWNANLQELFDKSKREILQKVQEGVRTFEFGRPTMLQCDWSKQGVGYILLQKHCSCPLKLAPQCCPEGWKIIFAGSRFNTPPESRYSPTEGEALAISWALKNARYYTEGCPDLTVITDHKPLLGIFADRELGSISNTRIRRLKESTMAFRFKILHCPGKLLSGPDTLSRYPVAAEAGDVDFADKSEDLMTIEIQDTVQALIDETSADTENMLTLERLVEHCSKDSTYSLLMHYVENGFPRNKQDVDKKLVKFWGIRNELYQQGELVIKDGRIVIPLCLQSQVVKILHSAHQGCTGMNSRAAQAVFWPGMSKDIINFRLGCSKCAKISPSNKKEPMLLTPVPEWPFQHTCMDFCEFEGHTYLAVADRYSGWLMIYHFTKQATGERLVAICRDIFSNYGIADSISSDGGPQFKSNVFDQFLKKHGVHHRKSSVDYPQSNGRAEAAVKTAKRLIMDNTTRRGSLNTDRMMQGLLQYRNTPLQGVDLSPAQILLHRPLKDALPALPGAYKMHSFWLEQAQARLRARARQEQEKQNKIALTNLPPLSVGDKVLIQNKRTGKRNCWDRSGVVISVKPNRQYEIQLDSSGGHTLRNRRHLRVVSQGENQVRTGSDEVWPLVQRGVPQSTENSPVAVDQGAPLVSPQPPSGQVPQQPDAAVSTAPRLPRALSRLLPHNSPGLNET